MSTQKTLDDFYKRVNGKLIFSLTANKKTNMEIKSGNEIVISSDDDSEIFKSKKIVGNKIKIKYKRIIQKQRKNKIISDSSSCSSQASTDLSPSKRRRTEILVEKELIEVQLNSPKKLTNTVNKTSHLSSLNSNCPDVKMEIYSQNSDDGDSFVTNFSDDTVILSEKITDTSFSDSSSQTKSIQSDLPAELEGEARSGVNLSQASDVTEEYDANEYEETIREFLKSRLDLNTTGTPNSCDDGPCLENLIRSAAQDTPKRRNVAKNLFPSNEKRTKQVQTDFSQDTTSPPSDNVMFQTVQHSVALQVCSNEIIKETNQLVKNVPGTSSEPSLSSPSKSIGGSDKILKKNNEKTNDEKSKPDSRYSEENHQRLCTNIQHITGWVLERFGTVLTRENTTMIHSLLNLENMLYKAFVLRLYTRKDNWYNFDDLCRILKITFDGDGRAKMLGILEEKKLIDTGKKTSPKKCLL